MQIGIEVGARTLRLAWLRLRRGGRCEWGYREQPRAQEDSPEALKRDLAQLLLPVRAHRLSAQLFLAAPDSYIRRLTLRVLNLKQLPEAIRAQLPTLLPFEAGRAQVQYQLHRQQPVDGQLECALSVAACERAAILQELEALWRIGWMPRAVVPSSLALAKAASALVGLGQDPVVLMALGESRTTMVLMESSAVVYARDVALGSDHLVDALMSQEALGESGITLSREQAKAFLQEVGIPSPERFGMAGQSQVSMVSYQALIQPVLEQLVSELRRTMAFGVHTGIAAAPSRVLVGGDALRLAHVDQWLAKQLGVPVVLLSCESLMGKAGSAAAIVCGLALCDRRAVLDLHLPSWKQRGTFMRAAARAWKGLAAICLVIWLLVIGVAIRHRMLARQLGALELQGQGFQKVEDLKAALDTHASLIQRLATQRALSPAWLRQLARGFPGAVRLTRLSVDAKHNVRLSAEAQEREQAPEAYVSELSLWLEQSGLCKDVQLGATHRLSASGNLLEFDITCTGL
jgi:Tfp pilus assembly PilM family ATPase/Tfp pilus assembly protein PilN